MNKSTFNKLHADGQAWDLGLLLMAEHPDGEIREKAREFIKKHERIQGHLDPPDADNPFNPDVDEAAELETDFLRYVWQTLLTDYSLMSEGQMKMLRDLQQEGTDYVVMGDKAFYGDPSDILFMFNQAHGTQYSLTNYEHDERFKEWLVANYEEVNANELHELYHLELADPNHSVTFYSTATIEIDGKRYEFCVNAEYEISRHRTKYTLENVDVNAMETLPEHIDQHDMEKNLATKLTNHYLPISFKSPFK